LRTDQTDVLGNALQHSTIRNTTMGNRDSVIAASVALTRENDKTQMHGLYKELVNLQRHIIHHEDKVRIILEGRDAAGKDGSIKRIVKHLSPRETRVVPRCFPRSHSSLLASSKRASASWGWGRC
jgi:polyphosphate kinase 2 (PPK2 family)